MLTLLFALSLVALTHATTYDLPVIQMYGGSSCNGTYSVVVAPPNGTCYLDPRTGLYMKWNCNDNSLIIYGSDSSCSSSNITVTNLNQCGDPLQFSSGANIVSTIVTCNTYANTDVYTELIYTSKSACTSNGAELSQQFLVNQQCVLDVGGEVRIKFDSSSETVSSYNGVDCTGNPASISRIYTLTGKCTPYQASYFQYCNGIIMNGNGCYTTSQGVVSFVSIAITLALIVSHLL